MSCSDAFQTPRHESSVRPQNYPALRLSPPHQSTSSPPATTTAHQAIPESIILLAEATPAVVPFWQNTDVWVFIAGVFPFAWATVEFWRRVMGGDMFGTGTDSIIIGIDDSPEDSRGARVLGKDALITAYVLFTIAFGTLGVTIYSVISSGPIPDELPRSAEAIVTTLFLS